MNIYNAIMKAADHIEQNPKRLDFMTGRVPTDCGSPGCALGWIGHFAGSQERFHDSVCSQLFKLSTLTFYFRLSALDGQSPANTCIGEWANNPELCVKALRAYAVKYHGGEKPKTPDWNALASQQTVADHVRSQEIARV